MKLKIAIVPNQSEDLIVYAREKTPLLDKICELVKERENLFAAYRNDEITLLREEQIICFSIEDSKLYAYSELGKMKLKERLCDVEELLGNSFVKINQSCIANIKKIAKFDTSLAGSLIVVFNDGRRDYVSRRRLKYVKNKLGIK